MSASDLAWESLRWGKTTYEGLMSGPSRHGLGVAKLLDGSRYEGEWDRDRRHGFGTYTWVDGSSYSGEWEDNKMQGCGVWKTKQGARFTTQEGQFVNSRFVGPGLACPVETARFAAKEASDAASKARGFQLEPKWLA